MPRAEPSVPNETLRHLQETLLEAVLLNQRLPGGEQPVLLPDLPWVLRQSTVILIDENLAESISAERLPMPISVLPLEALKEEARTRGDVAYLRFQPAEIQGDTVRLTLQAGIVPEDPNRRALGLSGLQVQFQEGADRWEVTSEPVFFAT
jgi:hypothetical protein